MKASQIIARVKATEELTRKRFACAYCGNTWIELVGHVVWNKDETESIHLEFGMESENCQTCEFRCRHCRKCGSRNVYEIRFLDEFSGEVPLSFKEIKRINRVQAQ